MPDRESLARGTDAEVWALLDGELQRLGRADPFQALGLGYEADEAAIRAAFLTATKVFHPNRFARRDREVLRVANEVYLRVKEAYQAIGAAEQRARVLAKLGKGSASQRALGPPAAPRARALGTSPPATDAPAADPPAGPASAPTTSPATSLERTPASRPLARRMTTAADVTEQVLERQRAARAELDRAKQLLDQGELEEARKRFHAIAADHPAEKSYRAWLHYAIGRQREAASDPARARTEYRRALELDDSFEEARRAMNALPKEGPAGGLFSRLFRK